MKVKIGNVVKNIPHQYAIGLGRMTEGLLERKNRIRLTPYERFLLASFTEVAKVVDAEPLYTDMLKGVTPAWCVKQINRSGDVRYLIRFVNSSSGITDMLCRNSTYNVCPTTRRVSEPKEFV